MKPLLVCAVLTFWAVLLPSGFPVHAGEDHHGEDPEMEAPEMPNRLLDQGDRAPLFALTDQNHRKIALSDFSGRPRFLVFIYTHCKDVCPLILQDRKRLEKDLEQTIGTGVVFLGVSVDPENDSPEALQAFIKETGVETKNLHLLTGARPEVEKVLRAYDIGVIRDAATGLVEGHSALGFAIGRDGMIKEVFNFSS